MLKKIICIFSVVLIFFCCFKSYSLANSDVYKFWNNLPSNNQYNGAVIDYGNLPTEIGANDKIMFYYYHNWASNHVNYNFGFAVFRNSHNNFLATYSPVKGNGDGVINFSGFTGCTIYNYNPSNYGYSVIYNNASNTTYQLGHTAILGYTAQMIYDDTIPSIFYSNFDLVDSTDNSKVVYYGGIYNSSLVFEDASSLRLGGSSSKELVLTNYFGNYSPTYEPVLYVYVGNNVSADTLVSTVYLNSFRLNSGNYSIPYNRIFPTDYGVGSNIWFLLKTTDNNNKYVYSFSCYSLTGSISISDYTPTDPYVPAPTPTPGQFDEIVSSQQQTTNAIQEQTQVIEQQTNAVQEQTQAIDSQTNAIQEQTQTQQEFNDNFYDDDPDIPTDIDVEDNVVNNTTDLTTLFNNIRNALNNRDSNDKGFTFTLPNGDDFTINLPVRFIHNILTENEGLATFINIFWQVVFGGYIIFDFKKLYDKFKNGDVEGAMNSSPTDNVVKEALR